MTLNIQCVPLPFEKAGWNHDWAENSGGIYGYDLSAISCGNVTAKLSVLHLPDDTASLVLAAPQLAGEGNNQEAKIQLLQKAVQLVDAQRARVFRCQILKASESVDTDALQRAGFRKAAEFSHQRTDLESLAMKATPHTDGIQYSVYQVQRSRDGSTPRFVAENSEIAPPEFAAAVESNLDRILDSADDATAIPRSSATQLIRLWSLLNCDARLQVACWGQQPCGLATYSCPVSPGDSSLAATLEYVGVLPGYRRRGIGRELLRRMAEDIQAHVRCRSRTVNAYVDCSNISARSLYTSMAFEETAASSVWIHELK